MLDILIWFYLVVLQNNKFDKINNFTPFHNLFSPFLIIFMRVSHFKDHYTKSVGIHFVALKCRFYAVVYFEY